ncbi:hypothetical protein ACFQHO_02270 [Actinomadura yumaensis]
MTIPSADPPYHSHSAAVASSARAADPSGASGRRRRPGSAAGPGSGRSR